MIKPSDAVKRGGGRLERTSNPATSTGPEQSKSNVKRENTVNRNGEGGPTRLNR
jgi:hypothetical protein